MIRLRHVYLALCVPGAILPYTQFLPFLRDHGLNLPLFFDELFSTRIGAFFGWDVIVSAVVLWVFVLVEGRRAGVKNLWAPLAASLLVGVSLGLPLFLYQRQAAIDRHQLKT